MSFTYDDFYDTICGKIQNLYFKIHAVYGHDDSDMKGYYMAVLDLFEQGSTYKMFFSMDDNHKITIVHLKRWNFG